MARRVTVLGVGNSDSFRCLMRRLEREHDVTVRRVRDEREVVDALDDGGDCVLVDDAVLDEAGGATVEAVRDRRKDVPVVALHRTGEQAARASAAGANRCVRGDGDRSVVAQSAAVAVRGAVSDREADRPSEDESIVHDALDTLTDIFFVFDLSRGMIHWNSRVLEVTGYDDDAVAGKHPTDFVAEDDNPAIYEAIQRVVEEGRAQVEAQVVTADGERIPYELTGVLLRDGADEPVAIAGTGRDITDRKRREQALELQAGRLETLNHINAVIRDVNEALIRASTREEIERTVCEHLAGAETYCFAWIGEFGVTGEAVEPQAWAGDEAGYLDDRPSDPSGAGVTAETAIRTREMQVAQNIAENPTYEPWSEAALERGYRSAAAIPLVYRGTTYGVLCVYAFRTHAFDDTEREVLEELGKTIGYAISAAEQRRALVSDTVVELELAFENGGPFFVETSRALDCEFTLEGVVEGSDGDVSEFFGVREVSFETLKSFADERGFEVTLVTEYEDERIVRVSTDQPSIASLVAFHGGVLRAATAADGKGSVTIELPREASIRTVVQTIRRTYPGAALRSQHERERTSTRGLEFRSELDEALTERQREVLETAFHAGFFEWPRGSTAEEVAESLGISPPTFHEHIRRVQRKLLTAYLRGEVPDA